MSDSLIITVLSFAGALLSGTIGHVLGQRAERRRQSLVIRAEMLKPIDEWLKGAEKIVGIFSDTLASIRLNMRQPVSYNFDERRKASNFMAETNNEVFGIIESRSLHIRQTKRSAKGLSDAIRSLDSLIKFQLLPTESEIVDRSNKGSLTDEYMIDSAMLKAQADTLLQTAHSFIAQLKTALT